VTYLQLLLNRHKLEKTKCLDQEQRARHCSSVSKGGKKEREKKTLVASVFFNLKVREQGVVAERHP